jgi:hypothetical protein
MRLRAGWFGVGAAVALGSAWLMMRESDVISGVVTSPDGPEAGVWVIAETDDLGTKFRKIVVTDDEGRFLLPELPTASYRVWVRGYGLVDSDPVTATPGQDLALSGVTARTPQEAAAIYPASSWLALMEPPGASEFPGTGPQGNGISAEIETLDEFVFNLKGCLRCHQVGTKWTREIPATDEHASTLAAWDHRVQMGQRGGEMSNFMSALGRQRGLRMFADWSDRIAAGEVPAAPERPKGVERNVVLTVWEWTNEMGKVHDEVATDKRDPRINANGPIYGTDIANDNLAILDPLTHTTKLLPIPTLADRTTMPASYASDYPVPSRLAKLDRFNPTSIHNPMIDAQGRVWYTATLRPPADQPSWCTDGSDNKYAAYFPLERAGRNLSYYDPRTQQFTMVDTCFGGHHLQFGFDQDQTLYVSQPSGDVFGWVNTRQFDLTPDARRSQGWCPTVVDTNGDGSITKPWNEPTPLGDDEVGYEGFDASRDTRVVVGAYGLVVNPVDGSVWGAQESYPGKIVRLEVGDSPPESCKAEIFEVPSGLWGVAPGGEVGFKPRGLDVDRNGVIWAALAGTNHLASFEREKCAAVNELRAHDGRQCAEGWTLHPLPGPTFKGTSFRADFYYYNWVDQFNTLGLGENVPIATGSGSNSLIAWLPETGESVVMRVPYPIGGFHPRGLDGRIDDPSAGWKGRGVYSSTGSDGVWHAEGGLGLENGRYTSISKPILVKFQIRPDPLAR